MANANAPLEFNGEQRQTVAKLALAMKLVAIVLLGLAAIGVAAGALALVNGSVSGILGIVEGLLTGLLSLIMLSSSTDVRYMIETNFAAIHFGNALRNLTGFYKTQFFLALLLIAIAVIRLFVG
jgi:hypothetical protein